MSEVRHRRKDILLMSEVRHKRKDILMSEVRHKRKDILLTDRDTATLHLQPPLSAGWCFLAWAACPPCPPPSPPGASRLLLAQCWNVKHQVFFFKLSCFLFKIFFSYYSISWSIMWISQYRLKHSTKLHKHSTYKIACLELSLQVYIENRRT